MGVWWHTLIVFSCHEGLLMDVILMLVDSYWLLLGTRKDDILLE
jgi:hypothetical protein